jgi:RND family efflux transporter MFP subunit
MSRRAVVWVLPALAVLAGCGEKHADKVEETRPVRVITVGWQEGARTLGYAGEVRARHETRLAFRVGGKIVERRVDVGSRVRAGDPIARLDATDLALAAASAQAQITSLESERALAAAELERSRELRAKNYISQAEFDRRASAFATVEARLEAARAQHRQAANQAAYATLVADSDGVITAVEAEAGQVVGAGQTVVRLARLAPRRPARGELEVAFAVPESQRGFVERARGLTVTLNARPGKSWKGSLRELAPAADPATRTYAARVAIADADAEVELGMSARVEIDAAGRADRIEIPFAALYAKDDAAQVFVLQPDGTVRLRPVKTAGVAGERVVIESGLAPGDVVVAAGAQLLRPGQRVRVLAEPASASRAP